MTMTRKSVPPSTKETAFACPHCGAYTTQTWHDVYSTLIDKGTGTPFLGDDDALTSTATDKAIPPDVKEKVVEFIRKLMSGSLFYERIEKSLWGYFRVYNLSLSECFNCHQIAVWIHDRLLFPPERHGVQPNPDLSEDVLHDYEEARSILDLSPRGAAALLRLCIQKLCIQLEEKGKNLDENIASLVAKGLNPLVQKSLDIVRVIGNEAVHPGVMDLKDDRDTATVLFGLVNSIADQMITHPKTVDTMYKKLPEGKRAAIEKRDAKVIAKPVEK